MDLEEMSFLSCWMRLGDGRSALEISDTDRANLGVEGDDVEAFPAAEDERLGVAGCFLAKSERIPAADGKMKHGTPNSRHRTQQTKGVLRRHGRWSA